MKRALVLASGGARGAYQIGMLRELVIHQGIDFDIIRGVSVGALNAAYLAQAPVAGNALANLQQKVEELHRLWTTDIRGNDSVYEKRKGVVGLAIGADSIYSLKPLRTLFQKHLSLEALRTSGRDFAVGAVSLVSGKYKEWTPNDPRFIERILASASIPVIFPPVTFSDEREVLVDGAVRNTTPLASAFKAQPDEIYVLLASRLPMDEPAFAESAVPEEPYGNWQDNALGTRVSGLDVLKRTIEILIDEIYLDDIRGAMHWNSIAEAAGKLRALAGSSADMSAEVADAIHELSRRLASAKKRAVDIRVFAPKVWFGSENSSTEFSPQLIQEAIAHGEKVATENVPWRWRNPA
jgi:NTE family protein